MTNKTNSFSGLSDNTTVTTGNSGGASGTAFDAVSGTVVAEADNAIVGTMGARATLASSASSYVQYSVSGSTHYVRMYVQAVAPTFNRRLIWWGTLGSTGDGWDIRQNSGENKFQVATRNTTRVWTSSGYTSGWYRLEAKIVPGASGTIDARVYDSSGTLLETLTQYVGQVDSPSTINFGVGHTSAQTHTAAIDEIGWSDTTWLGAAAAPASVDYELSAIYTANTTNIGSWVLDASGSIGTVTLTQTDGTTASKTESPTKVFTITNPAGVDSLEFDLEADQGSGDVVTVPITILRSAVLERPAMWVFQGGTASDIDDWR